MEQIENVSENIEAKKAPSLKVKTNPKYNVYRYSTKKWNTQADDFVYVKSISRSSQNPVVPEMAGITQSSPDYHIRLHNSGFGSRYLVVLEYVVSGSGYIEYNGLTKKVSAGDFYVLSPEFDGSYYPDPQDPFVKKWLNVNGQLTPNLLKTCRIQDIVFSMRFDAEKYIDDIHSILANYDERDSYDADREISHILLDLFLEVRNKLDIQKRESPIEIKEIHQYIRENLSNKGLNVEYICNAFYIGRRTLDRLFKREMGISPIKYITSCKIELAQQMLAEDLSVEDVSERCGFSSPTYFRKVFLSVCGESPQKYKQRMKNKKKG